MKFTITSLSIIFLSFGPLSYASPENFIPVGEGAVSSPSLNAQKQRVQNSKNECPTQEVVCWVKGGQSASPMRLGNLKDNGDGTFNASQVIDRLGHKSIQYTVTYKKIIPEEKQCLNGDIMEVSLKVLNQDGETIKKSSPENLSVEKLSKLLNFKYEYNQFMYFEKFSKTEMNYENNRYNVSCTTSASKGDIDLVDQLEPGSFFK